MQTGCSNTLRCISPECNATKLAADRLYELQYHKLVNYARSRLCKPGK